MVTVSKTVSKTVSTTVSNILNEETAIRRLQEHLANDDLDSFRTVLNQVLKNNDSQTSTTSTSTSTIDLFYLYLTIYLETFQYNQTEAREYLKTQIFHKIDPISQKILNNFYFKAKGGRHPPLLNPR